MANLAKIDDAGEFIPYAKKHLARKPGTSIYDTTLTSLWPEPDWHLLPAPPSIVSYQAVLYRGLRPRPRPAGFGVSDEEWLQAYLVSTTILKSLLMNIKTISEIDSLKGKFFRELGVNITNRSGELFRDIYPAYALGRGNGRVYKTPFALTFLQEQQIRWLPEYDWPQHHSMLNVNVFPMQARSGQWGLYEVKGNKGIPVSDEHFCSETESIHAAKKFIAGRSQKKSGRDRVYIPVKPSVRESISHPDIVDQQISTDKLMADFGIGGIQFGNSLSNIERQNWVNNIYISFYILSKVIAPRNIKWLGLGGIKLAFGARGSSTAVAHYEPSLNVINLTRHRGPGSLAHEWFHALDHRLGKSADLQYASEFNSHWQRSNAPNSKVALCRQLEAIVRAISDKSGRGQDCLFTRSLLLDSQTPRWSREGYWTLPYELSARAFEAYVEDQCIQAGMNGSWLSSGTLASDYDASRRHFHPYPLGGERVGLNRRFASFMAALFCPSHPSAS